MTAGGAKAETAVAGGAGASGDADALGAGEGWAEDSGRAGSSYLEFDDGGEEPMDGGFGLTGREEAWPTNPQSVVEHGTNEPINAWGPVISSFSVPLEGGGTTSVNRLSSPDPFTATYQLEDGSILVTNVDLTNGIPDLAAIPASQLVQWTSPDQEVLDIYEGEICVLFDKQTTEEYLWDLIDEHNLEVILSWFEPSDLPSEENAIAWFYFNYDSEEFETFDEAFSYFSSIERAELVLPNIANSIELDYAGLTNPNDPLYQWSPPNLIKNAHITALRADTNPWIRLGRSIGEPVSTQIVVVLDNGVVRSHPDFRFKSGPYMNLRSIARLGVDVTAKGYKVGWGLGEATDPDLGRDPSGRTMLSHGTAMAGLYCSVTNDNTGIASLSPSHAVLPICMKGSAITSYDQAKVTMAVRALSKELAHGKWWELMRVVNMSFSCGYNYGHGRDIAADLRKNDRLYVAAAGNTGVDGVVYPAGYPQVLGVTGLWTNVTGTNFQDVRGAGWPASNYRDENPSFTTYPVSGIYWWIEAAPNTPTPHPDGLTPCAPWQGVYGMNYFSYYTSAEGTSGATATVGALAATLYDIRPHRDYTQVRNQIVLNRKPAPQGSKVAGMVDYYASISGW